MEFIIQVIQSVTDRELSNKFKFQLSTEYKVLLCNQFPNFVFEIEKQEIKHLRDYLKYYEGFREEYEDFLIKEVFPY